MRNINYVARTLLLILLSLVTVQPASGRGTVVFNKDTGFSLTQNKMVDGHRSLHATIAFRVKNYANASATATFRVEDTAGNLLSTTEGKATLSRSLNLKNNNDAKFTMNFDLSNHYFLSNSRVGKKLRAKFVLKINGEVMLNVYKDFTAKKATSSGQKSDNNSNGGKSSKSKSTPAPKKHNHNNSNPTAENRQWEEVCPLCGGGGLCMTCGGAGQYYSPAAGMMWPCASCYSSGKCRMCQGKGKNVYRVYTVNGIRYMQINADAPQVLGGSDDGHRCGACSGLGRCAVCQGSGHGVSYTGSAPICSACNGTGRCNKCGGSGWR